MVIKKVAKVILTKCFLTNLILLSPYLLTKYANVINLRPLEIIEHNKKIKKLKERSPLPKVKIYKE